MRVVFTKTFVSGPYKGIGFEQQIARLSPSMALGIVSVMQDQEVKRIVLMDYTGNCYRISHPEAMEAADGMAQ